MKIMTNQQTTTTNHAVRRTSRNTARIAIESSAARDPARKPEIWRFYLDSSGVPQMHRGGILGRKAGKTCALVINVRPGDLICVREKLAGIVDHQWRYFRIGNSYEPIPADLPNRCLSKREAITHLKNTDSRETHEMEFSEEDLRKLFVQRHPDWLQRIACRQLSHWRTSKPEKFFLFAPGEIAGVDIPLCVKIAPYAALARFQDRLDRKQLEHCLLHSPLGAVKYAVGMIARRKRRHYFSKFAREALLYSADRLSETDFMYCVALEMGTAFQTRNRMSPERRALVLAHSYLIVGAGYSGDALARLHEEIRESIVEHPAQWRASDPQGFPSIFQGLLEYVNMKIDPITILTLLRTTDPADQKAIAQSIVQGI